MHFREVFFKRPSTSRRMIMWKTSSGSSSSQRSRFLASKHQPRKDSRSYKARRRPRKKTNALLRLKNLQEANSA